MFVKPPQLLAQDKLSAKMPAAMPSYSPDLDWGILTVSLLLNKITEQNAHFSKQRKF